MIAYQEQASREPASHYRIGTIDRVRVIHDVANTNIVEKYQRGLQAIVLPLVEARFGLYEFYLPRLEGVDHSVAAQDADSVEYQFFVGGIKLGLNLRPGLQSALGDDPIRQMV